MDRFKSDPLRGLLFFLSTAGSPASTRCLFSWRVQINSDGQIKKQFGHEMPDMDRKKSISTWIIWTEKKVMDRKKSQMDRKKSNPSKPILLTKTQFPFDDSLEGTNEGKAQGSSHP